MVHLTVCPKREDVEPMRTPGDDRWSIIERPAEPLPATRRSPAGPIQNQMIQMIVVPRAKDIEPIRPPRGNRRRTTKDPTKPLPAARSPCSPIPSYMIH